MAMIFIVLTLITRGGYPAPSRLDTNAGVYFRHETFNWRPERFPKIKGMLTVLLPQEGACPRKPRSAVEEMEVPTYS